MVISRTVDVSFDSCMVRNISGVLSDYCSRLSVI